MARVPTIYVTGHRNPDTDSIASAIGYAELQAAGSTRATSTCPVRLGDAQRADRAGCSSARGAARARVPAPRPAARARRHARRASRSASQDEPVRQVGLRDGARGPRPRADRRRRRRAGRRDDRARARAPLHPRVARGVAACRRADRGRARSSRSLEGELRRGRASARSTGACGCWRWTSSRCRASIGEGDVVVVGDRDDAQRRAIELGVALLVTSNGTRARPTRCSRSPASTARPSSRSPLDSYVTGRMVTLSAPCRALMDAEPLTVRPDDLLADVAEEIKDDPLPRGGRRRRRGAGRSGSSPAPTSSTPSRAACCSSTTPSRPRACPASSRPRSSRSSTTTTSARSRRRSRCAATFDPVGSTATLVDRALPPERHGAEPADGDDAARRRAVGHRDPQLADDDRARPRRRRVPRARARARRRPTSGARCSRRPPTSRASPPTRSSRRDAKEYAVGERPDDLHRPDRDGRAQACSSAATSCWRRCERRARRKDYAALRADGHRHPRQGHQAARRGRPGAARARVRRASSRTARSTCPAS